MIITQFIHIWKTNNVIKPTLLTDIHTTYTCGNKLKIFKQPMKSMFLGCFCLNAVGSIRMVAPIQSYYI